MTTTSSWVSRRRAWALAGALTASAMAAVSPALAGTLELGIDRSNLAREPDDVRQSTLEGIHALGAVWFRDTASGSSVPPKGQAILVDEVRQAKALHLKMLLNILPVDADYDDGNAGAPKTRCGWAEHKLSRVSPAKLTERLERLLGAFKAANVEIDAFEIGNEDDTSCYDADIPDGHYASDQELHTAVLGYAHFLQTATETIKRPEFYPHAKVITFGLTHGSDVWDNPPHHVSRPARMIAMLRNLDGFNYLDNARYHIDGIGTHIYPKPNDIAASITEKLQEDAAIIGRDKPFWVTEWGFLKETPFPTQRGQSVDAAVEECLSVFERLKGGIPLGPVMFYSYDTRLVDGAGRPTQTAQVLRGYANGR